MNNSTARGLLPKRAVFPVSLQAVALLYGLFGLSVCQAHSGSTVIAEEIEVDGYRIPVEGLSLSQKNTAASRLGLSLLELPASAEIIDQEEMSLKGDFAGLSAVTRATGIAASASPGNGGTSISARGFNGHSSVVYTYDGIRLYVGAGTATFPADTWTVERVEVLRGSGSVINGVGAIGATLNYVPKKPRTQKVEHELQLSAGSNQLQRLALGSGGPLSSNLSYRLDIVNHRTDGYVNRAEESRTAFTGALNYQFNSNVFALFSLDYATTDAAPYWGSPLVEGEVPATIRRNNYNVLDGLVEYRDLWPRVHFDWKLAENIIFRNDTFFMKANRHWRNVESYDYNNNTGLVDRSFYLEIMHDQKHLGSRSEVLGNFKVNGWENTLSVGAEFNQIDFTHTNNAPYSGTTSVSLINPVVGSWSEGVVDETTLDYTTDTFQHAIFLDDMLKFNDYWSVVAGIRYDSIDYHRDDVQRSNGQDADTINNTLSGASWRLGGVYQPKESTSLYAQYSTAVDGIQSILTATDPGLTLAEGRQIEFGVKQSLLDGKLQYTVALYDIVKSDLLSQDPGGIQRQIGQQSSQGIEFDVFGLPVEQLSIDFNFAVVQPEYDEFISGGNEFSGNVPRNVPETTTNIWLTWLPTQTLALSAGARHVGARFANDANTLELPKYTVWDSAITWHATEAIALNLRGKNLTNTDDYVLAPYGNQWVLGDGRTVELSMSLSL